MKEIYQQTAEEVLERVESRESGLTDEQVRRSREKCGWNEKERKKVFCRSSLNSIRIFWC